MPNDTPGTAYTDRVGNDRSGFEALIARDLSGTEPKNLPTIQVRKDDQPFEPFFHPGFRLDRRFLRYVDVDNLSGPDA